MKIVYCIEGTFNSGGMEKIITTKANLLSEMGHSVFIITTEQRGRSPFFPINGGIKTIDLSINYTDYLYKGVLKKVIGYFQKRHLHKKRLTKVLKTISADIVISTFGHEVPFLYKINDGSKKIAEIHFTKNYRLLHKRSGLMRYTDIIRTFLNVLIAKKYDKFVVLTQEDKSYWGNLKNITVIPNFLTSIPNQTAELKNKICLAVGRMDYQKGFDNLIKIWNIVYKSCPDWELHIYGEGPLKETLSNMIKEAHLNKVISIYPPTKEIEKIFMQSSMYVLSSRYEGLPMVMLEASSYGLPIISFSCKCGPKDIIKEGINGYLIEEGNLKDFADKIIFLIKNMNKRSEMGKNAQLLISQYNVQNIMKQWYILFNSLVPNNK